MSELRIIKTARSLDEINAAARNGFRPLVKPVIPSPDIKSKFAVMQRKSTGEIEIIHDFRLGLSGYKNSEHELVIDFTEYYPYAYANPYAAYLLPADLRPGERVILEDLVEDMPGFRWNQGDTFRLPSCTAIWNGNDFEPEYDRSDERSIILG